MKEMQTNDISPDSRKKRPFHPADPPHGSKNYDPEALESEQKTELAQRKLSMRKENELYFKKHPEIQGFVSMILRHLLDKKPYTTDQVQDLVGLFFARPLQIIASELLDYLREIKYEGSLITELSQMKQQRPKMQ